MQSFFTGIAASWLGRQVGRIAQLLPWRSPKEEDRKDKLPWLRYRHLVAAVLVGGYLLHRYARSPEAGIEVVAWLWGGIAVVVLLLWLKGAVSLFPEEDKPK